MLQRALDYAGANQSSGVVILHKGRILAEQHFDVQGTKTAEYKERVLGKDEFGRAIEDVASVQKSVAAILVGIAQGKRLLKIDDRVSQHLGAGWSRATPDQENAICAVKPARRSGSGNSPIAQNRPNSRASWLRKRVRYMSKVFSGKSTAQIVAQAWPITP